MKLTWRQKERILNDFKESFQRNDIALIADELYKTDSNESGSCHKKLLDELNVNNANRKFGLLDAISATLITGDFEPWQRVASLLGYSLVKNQDPEIPVSVIEQAARVVAESGDVLRELGPSIKDQKIDPDERERLEKEIRELEVALATFKQVIRFNRKAV